MKLYSSPNSPFGARLTIACRIKDIQVDSVPLPAGGLRSDEFLALNPVAKIPVLVTEGGTVLVESSTILDYLEERFPLPSLRPLDPEARARVAGVCRLIDTYVAAPVIRLFPHLDPARREDAVVRAETARWADGLSVLSHFMREPLPATEAGLSLADCLLPTTLHLSTRIAAILGMPRDPLEEQPVLRAYYRQAAEHIVIGPVLDDLTNAQASADAGAGRPSIEHRHRAMA